MRALYLILALVPLSILFRYLVEQTQAARVVGVKLASPDFLAANKNGFQDSVSIPEANNWFFGSAALLVGGLVWLAIGFGWMEAVAGVLIAYAAAILAQVLVLPKRDSWHFTLSIFNSMGRRYADYERDGDKHRAEAMRYLLDRFLMVYGSEMARGNQKR